MYVRIRTTFSCLCILYNNRYILFCMRGGINVCATASKRPLTSVPPNTLPPAYPFHRVQSSACSAKTITIHDIAAVVPQMRQEWCQGVPLKLIISRRCILSRSTTLQQGPDFLSGLLLYGTWGGPAGSVRDIIPRTRRPDYCLLLSRSLIHIRLSYNRGHHRKVEKLRPPKMFEKNPEGFFH